MTKPYDVIVVGVGILGLAHAWHAARMGYKVLMLDTTASAQGASVRNFGFVTVTGQRPGEDLPMAVRSAAIWKEVSEVVGISIEQTGAWFVAQSAASEAVLNAYLRESSMTGCCLLAPEDWQQQPVGPFLGEIQAILHSPHELRINPREGIPKLLQWLCEHAGVHFEPSAHVQTLGEGWVQTPETCYQADHVFLCLGDRLQALLPEVWRAFELRRCMLQMLRLEPIGVRLDHPMLTDLSLIRYPGFATLQETQALRVELTETYPRHLEEGVHLIVVQDADGSLVVGDSHAYGDDVVPFRREEVDQLILDAFQDLLPGCRPVVSERWLGTYVSSAGPSWFIEPVWPGVHAVQVTSGAGMSLAFGLAEKNVQACLGKLGKTPKNGGTERLR